VQHHCVVLDADEEAPLRVRRRYGETRGDDERRRQEPEPTQ
jgi:hypothetical protein